jgi:dihydropteroate synthase
MIRPDMRDMRLSGGRILSFARGFAVMGIVNATPDSFHPGSRRLGAMTARDAALAMEAEGAAIVDIGGESTRPGAAPVSLDEELERVIPAIEAIRACSALPLSVDTRKTEVARAALAAGADIVNDITALRGPGMAEAVSGLEAPVILMHMLGSPETMQENPVYGDCLSEVKAFLAAAASIAEASGFPRGRIILDPGIGFGKRAPDNLALIAGLGQIVGLGYPVLVGVSRKRIIGEITGKPVNERLAGSIGAACAAWMGGAAIFRVHDVAETVDALLCLAACRSGIMPGGGS